MKGRTGEGAWENKTKSVSNSNSKSQKIVNTIFLLYDNDINSPAQCGRVDRIPCLGDGTAYRAIELHPARWCLTPFAAALENEMQANLKQDLEAQRRKEGLDDQKELRQVLGESGS
jgi:CelD/BcsL family acetyltransferase involved in cellulose biosynthesis